MRKLGKIILIIAGVLLLVPLSFLLLMLSPFIQLFLKEEDNGSKY
ncbi:Uncharacterised protein [Streptococcus pseudoporcinus]|uniref:Uncharacterized protein n=1 Tax=Streptococcus pseudoporcinus TaxID=361101 RepID=A0A4U9XL21_9STRE|nr:hypothetical protein Javan444_0002 [Streptococcus phage Javan444]VTS13298.1 Uncharacterised protein [Streptococcus pseudoporcinus]VUC64687.1 Uncharacterised protein [Streptococcus pseudoporcinus]VUC66497.1 Uncharacterised protein [Streptococcus pseudoporcinus]VUC97426.1 Uncharacterised protein [Streptococcus pseudoporcinus]